MVRSPIANEDMSPTECIVCKKTARASSIYCGDSCILKHAHDSLGTQSLPNKSQAEGKTIEKIKPESRVSALMVPLLRTWLRPMRQTCNRLHMPNCYCVGIMLWSIMNIGLSSTTLVAWWASVRLRCTRCGFDSRCRTDVCMIENISSWSGCYS